MSQVDKAVQRGYQKMAGMTAVICGTVRDCARGLQRNIPNVDLLLKKFQTAAAVFVENDSVDQTKPALSHWSTNRNDVHILSENTGIKTILDGAQEVNPWFSEHRINLMAKYRNKYLEFIKYRSSKPDYVIVVDMDVNRFSLDGIAHGFGIDAAWDSLSANGIIRAQNGWKYYDTYAYEALGSSGPQCTRLLVENQMTLAGMSAGDDIVRVNSGFGGVAIYDYPAIENCSYDCIKNDDPVITACCEHIAFHRQMAQNGFDRIFINPAQVVVY